MKFCTSCGSKLISTGSFCTSCGSKLIPSSNSEEEIIESNQIPIDQEKKSNSDFSSNINSENLILEKQLEYRSTNQQDFSNSDIANKIQVTNSVNQNSNSTNTFDGSLSNDENRRQKT